MMSVVLGSLGYDVPPRKSPEWMRRNGEITKSKEMAVETFSTAWR
jgi:hypothetical protein